MIFEKYEIRADLGTGSFVVNRYVKTMVGRFSELPTADGDHDRVITGFDVTYLLEGEYEKASETEFFDELLRQLERKRIVGAVIDGAECPALAAVKIMLTRSEDTFIGKYTIVLKEL